MILRVGETGFDLFERSLLVGVLDLCQSACADALARAKRLVEAGAGPLDGFSDLKRKAAFAAPVPSGCAMSGRRWRHFG